MSLVQHYIDYLDGNGFVEVKPPLEWKDTTMQLSFENGQEKISSDNFTFVGDTATGVNTFISGGTLPTTSPFFSVGIFEGLPYQVRVKCGATQYTIFDGCLNTASAEGSYSCEQVILGLREKGKIDFVNELADSFRFEYLFAIRQTPPFGNPVAGQITYNDFIDVWYVQGQYPQKFEILIASLTLFVTLKETFETVKRILDVAAEAFSVPSGGITSALQIIYLVIYLGLLIVALIDLMRKLIDLIFPFVYFHRAMYVRTLFQKACDYLGLNFSSTILNDVTGIGYNEYIMPSKNQEGEKVGNTSLETGFYEGTFGDLIRAYKEKFNAEVKVIGNTLYFEREDYFLEQSNFIIPNIYQKPFNEGFYNASDVASNYVISYRYDTADLNNLSNREGTQFQAKIEPTVIINKQNVLLKNLDERNIPFTLPLVKTTESELEKVLGRVFNALTGFINDLQSIISPQSTPIPNIPPGGHINVLLLDTHLTSAPKVGIYLGGGKTDPNSIPSYLSATVLWNNFHAVRSVKGFSPFPANQWRIRKGYEIPLCCSEYLILKDNNYAKFQGNDAKILNLEWNPNNEMATIDFAYREPYTNNLKLTAINWDNSSTVYL